MSLPPLNTLACAGARTHTHTQTHLGIHLIHRSVEDPAGQGRKTNVNVHKTQADADLVTFLGEHWEVLSWIRHQDLL